MKQLIFAAVAALLLSLPTQAVTVGMTDIVPRPSSVVAAPDSFKLTDGVATFTLIVKGLSQADAEALAEATALTQSKKGNVRVTVKSRSDIPAEGYTMKIAPHQIDITASDAAGAFYAIQGLLQLAEREGATAIACATVSDSPRLPYRGLHFDTSRHFRTVDFLKKQIDAMARLKLNKFHLHFTDGAGWRMPIDAYPRLTQYAAWRPQAAWTDWVKNGATYCEQTDPDASGGFYTKDELRDLVKYAAERHITVIPEIEMPGHSDEVVAAYPEFSCNGKGSDLCPGKEETFTFLENVLDETIDIFPSKLIHIGGDEASKEQWKTCADCLRRMETENLKNVDELQSYLIKRIENYLNSKGRTIIGWDEILEGGLAPNAVVMSWRGEEGGRQAMKEGHDVVMTPGEYCYIDNAQDAPFLQPGSIGGYTSLAKVYSYEPLPDSIPDAVASHLKGLQGNVWSEHITDDAHAEYMYYPRAYAIAEVAWSPKEKDYVDFHRRALGHNATMQAKGYSVFNLAEEYGERHEALDTLNHLALGAKVTYATPYHSKYPAAGPTGLTDGLRGGWSHLDRRWQGFTDDMDVTVDLGSEKPLHYLSAGFMQNAGPWIHLPVTVSVSLSRDGVNFTPAGTLDADLDETYGKTYIKNFGFPLDDSARYIRLTAKRNPRPGAWIFLDEIIVK